MHGRKVLVVGLGQSGKATVDYLLNSGYVLDVVDMHWSREDLQQYARARKVSLSSDHAPRCIDNYDYVVVSPGISSKHPLYMQAHARKIPVLGEAEWILRQVRQPCVGITGTNGKTTLTLFIEHLFHTAHQQARAIGNVGYPFAQYALEKGLHTQEVLVCELSSYQLETLTAQVLDVGVILHITPDHLDRYDSFQDYMRAKLRMIPCIKSSGLLLVHHEIATYCNEELKACKGTVITIPQLLSNSSEDSYLQLTKNKEYCGFLGLCQEKMLGLDLFYIAKVIARKFQLQDQHLREAIETFVKPPHRLELVTTIRGVRFVNDSKATNIESVLYAVNALPGALHLIVGGKDKALDFTPWKQGLSSRVRKLFVIGEAAEKIQKALHDVYSVERCKDLEDATRKAFVCAGQEGTILLSPGCASFDSYRNYMHRGESFREIVQALKKECSE